MEGISVAEHVMELTLGNEKPVHCAPCRIRPKAGEFEDSEIDKNAVNGSSRTG